MCVIGTTITHTFFIIIENLGQHMILRYLFLIDTSSMHPQLSSGARCLFFSQKIRISEIFTWIRNYYLRKRAVAQLVEYFYIPCCHQEEGVSK